MESITATALSDAFATVPDPRRRQGTRYPLTAILTLAVAAILADQDSVLAMAEWAASQSADLLCALGFPTGRTPHQSTLARLFQRLDPARLSTALRRVILADSPVGPTVRGSQGVAVDGKARRGQQAYADPATSVVQALTAVCHGSGLVLAQEPIAHDGSKAEAELTVAPRLIAQLDWSGRVFTGDALFCQRAICQQVLAAGGDYLLLVKANQPELYDDLRHLFDPPRPGPPLQDRRETWTVDHGHGRSLDTRHLVASTDLNTYLEWPGLAQVFQVERSWWDRHGRHRQRRYGITSLPPQVAGASDLLRLRRGHWIIENRLHYVKDHDFAEDRCTVHNAAGPIILSFLRDLAISLLRRAGYQAIAARLRFYSYHPDDLVSLLALEVPQNA
jgi:predicted transposase YbfD/YdcC